MFKGKDYFKQISCPVEYKCKRPYCPFKHRADGAQSTAKCEDVKLAEGSNSNNVETTNNTSSLHIHPSNGAAVLTTSGKNVVKKNPRKLPSYAPQNSPVVSKFTIDYKQIVRNCNSYKSPAVTKHSDSSREIPTAKPVNLFESFKETPSQNVKVEKENFDEDEVPKNISILSANNNNEVKEELPSSKYEPKAVPTPAVKPPIIFKSPIIIDQKIEEVEVTAKAAPDKVESSCKPPAPKAELKTNPLPKAKCTEIAKYIAPPAPVSRVSKIFDNRLKPPQSKVEPKPNKLLETPKYDTPKYEDIKTTKVPAHTWTPSIISQSVGVYKPGIGFCETPQPPKSEPPKPSFSILETEKVTSPPPGLNNSLDFNDPYNVIPDSTSPDADLAVTSKLDEFDYKPFQDPDEETPMKPPEPKIEAEKVEKEKTPSPQSSPEKDIDEVNVISKQDWLASIPKRERYEDDVFGKEFLTESPTKRFKKTFQKIPEKIPPKEEEAEEEESDLEEISINPSPSPPTKSIDESPINSSQTSVMSSSPPHSPSQSQSSDTLDNTHDPDETLASSDSSDDSTEEYVELKRQRMEQKLEEIKEIKAKIFIKQHCQAMSRQSESASSSSGSGSNSDDSSSEFSSPVKKSKTKVEHYVSDSESIDSSISVASDADVWLESDDSWVPEVSQSPGSPERKRKKLSSPHHDDDAADTILSSPEVESRPKPVELRSKQSELKVKHRKTSKTKHVIDPPGKTPPIINPQQSRDRRLAKLGQRKRPQPSSTLRIENNQSRSERIDKILSRERSHTIKINSLKVKPEQVIPHKKIIKDRDYDKQCKIRNQHMYVETAPHRPKNNKSPSNTNTFYSKVNKEDLKRFDLPEDPHRHGTFRTKSTSRVAHLPTTKPANKTPKAGYNPSNTVIHHPGGPRIDPNQRSHIPTPQRQLKLDQFISEYLKVCGDDKVKAYSASKSDEASIIKRCSTRPGYINMCSNNIKKIRDIGKGIVKEGAVDKEDTSSEKVQNFYQHLQKYLMKDDDLSKNHYPSYYRYRPAALDELACCRCSNIFELDDCGNYLKEEGCFYHSGKITRKKMKDRLGNADSFQFYSCCDKMVGNSEGCAMALGHVHHKPYVNRDCKDYVRSKPHTTSPSVWGLDCEMSYTAGGLELVRVTVVDYTGETVLDMLVKPSRPILDYNTRFSGIDEKILAPVVNALEDAQRSVLRLVSMDCILVGHSLESDLHALKLIHKNVVDTAIVFFGGNFKRGLKVLAAERLGRIIQEDDGGHNSTEDALASLDLMKHTLKQDHGIKL